MGSGKVHLNIGLPFYTYIYLFEMDGVPEEVAREAMRLASHKLPIKCKFMVKEQNNAEEE